MLVQSETKIEPDLRLHLGQCRKVYSIVNRMKYILYCFHLFVIKSNVYITVCLFIFIKKNTWIRSKSIRDALMRSISYNGEDKLLGLNL